MYATKEIQEFVTLKNSLGALRLEWATKSGINRALDFDIRNALVNLRATLDEDRISIEALKEKIESIQKLQSEQMQNKIDIECLKSFIDKKEK